MLGRWWWRQHGTDFLCAAEPMEVAGEDAARAVALRQSGNMLHPSP
jgi:hypothetical protein